MLVFRKILPVYEMNDPNLEEEKRKLLFLSSIRKISENFFLGFAIRCKEYD